MMRHPASYAITQYYMLVLRCACCS